MSPGSRQPGASSPPRGARHRTRRWWHAAWAALPSPARRICTSTRHAGEVRINDTVLHAGDRIAIDGSRGHVTLDDVPLVRPEVDERFATVLEWCDEVRTLGVRANADTPADARRAREFGAEGIGLCRTEHMFMAADRHPKMRAMIMAGTGRPGTSRSASCWSFSRATSKGSSR